MNTIALVLLIIFTIVVVVLYVGFIVKTLGDMADGWKVRGDAARRETQEIYDRMYRRR